jgi:hypothetical protein
MGRRHVEHTPENGPCLKMLYIGAIILWILGWIYYYYTFKHKPKILSLLVLSIPLIIWLTGYHNGNLITEDIEHELFDANFLVVSLLITIPLLSWLSSRIESQEKFIPLVMVGISLALLSALDMWVTKKWLAFSKHVKSILSTSAITIFVYVIADFYLLNKSKPMPFLSKEK